MWNLCVAVVDSVIKRGGEMSREMENRNGVCSVKLKGLPSNMCYFQALLLHFFSWMKMGGHPVSFSVSALFWMWKFGVRKKVSSLIFISDFGQLLLSVFCVWTNSLMWEMNRRCTKYQSERKLWEERHIVIWGFIFTTFKKANFTDFWYFFKNETINSTKCHNINLYCDAFCTWQLSVTLYFFFIGGCS